MGPLFTALWPFPPFLLFSCQLTPPPLHLAKFPSNFFPAQFHWSSSKMDFPQLNCTLLDDFFRNGSQNGSATALSRGSANAVSHMALTVGNVDYFIQHYIFPFQFCLGVLGNSINLVVLLSSGMKNQANILLSAMACADLALLFCMLPNSLVTFPLFFRSVRFAYFYFLSKIHFLALANCFSCAATFLVLAVSLERFIGVRHPMHTRFQLRDRRLLLLIFGIYGLAFALSFYHHIEYQVTIRVECGRVWANFQHVSQFRNVSSLVLTYLRAAKYTQSIVGILFPVIAVAVLNVSLVYFLRKRQILLDASGGDKLGEQEFRYSDIGTFQRRERKVTATVIAIISCFTITHLPTLGPVIWEHFLPNKRKVELVTLIAVFNCFLVWGKVLNFFLFCSSSAHFRRRTVLILNAQLCQRRSRKKYSSMALSNMATQTNLTQINNFAAHSSFRPHHHSHSHSHSSRPSHPSNAPPPSYRLQKQSTLSLREALLRQSGAEFDDPLPLPPLAIDPHSGRPSNGPQSARPVVFS